LEQHSENTTAPLVPEAHWEPVCDPQRVALGESDATSNPPSEDESSEQPTPNQDIREAASASISAWPEDAGIQIIRATRSWIQYGTVGFAVFCIVIGAVEALLGR